MGRTLYDTILHRKPLRANGGHAARSAPYGETVNDNAVRQDSNGCFGRIGSGDRRTAGGLQRHVRCANNHVLVASSAHLDCDGSASSQGEGMSDRVTGLITIDNNGSPGYAAKWDG